MNDYLFVPTNLQAFAVGKPGDQVYDLAPVPQSDDDIANWFVDGKYAFSFQNKRPPLEPGIHLHWALPNALMHTQHQGTGETEQPCIPNRWLVVRMWRAAGDTTIKSKAWVVESDYVSLDATVGGTPFFFATDSPAELGGKRCGYVGRTVPADGWRETHESYRFPLQSFGWGDSSFAAYYPACRGVLGFHDTITTEEVASGDLLTYLVIGWYSDPEMDPLREQNEDDLLATLGWSCANLEGAAVPRRTLCHGAVVNLQWHGGDEEYPAVSSGSTPPNIAIGGNGAEALAALLAPDEPSLQQALCALQYGQATQVTELNQMGDLLHRHRFGAVPGGTLWAIESDLASPTTDVLSPSENSSPAPMSANVQGLLGKLNEAQRALDRQARKVESLRWRLFACWVTWASKQSGPSGKRPNRRVVDSAMAAFREAAGELPNYKERVEHRREELAASLAAEKTGLRIAESTMPPFLHPKDPFVALTADNLIGVDRSGGQRSGQDVEGSLLCRLAKDVVTGLNQRGTTSKEWLADNCFTLNFPDAAGIPSAAVARTLALEALLFDPNSASLIGMTDDSIDLELFEALQESFEPQRKLSSSTLTWDGQPPDPLSVSCWGERNPWLPTHLMWQARWVPSEAHGLDNTSGEPVCVEFNPGSARGRPCLGKRRRDAAFRGRCHPRRRHDHRAAFRGSACGQPPRLREDGRQQRQLGTHRADAGARPVIGRLERPVATADAGPLFTSG
jgi:hypothetical protein